MDIISVVIPAKNAEKNIEACLQGILAQTGIEYQLEIIVVDDGSVDQTAKLAEKMGVSVIRQENRGPASARNTGACLAQGKIIAFTDADCVPTSEWLHHLLKPFYSSQNVVGVKGTYQTKQVSLVARFVQQEYESKYARLSKLSAIDFIDTYSAAYRRDVFVENGGFDSAFPVPSVEDQEFSFRLARKGYRMLFVPEAIVFHTHDQNWVEYAKRKFNIGYWKAFMLRWLPERIFSDSHTPSSLRIQIGLIGLTMTFAFIGIFWAFGRWLALISLLLFFMTGLPFLSQVVRQDKEVFWTAPFLLILRSISLGAGLLLGFVLPKRKHLYPDSQLLLGTRTIKRLMDILGALIGLILTSPIILLAALAIRLDSVGSPFFLQERAGEFGKPFRLVKLRTMILGADKRLGEVLGANSLKGPVFKIPNDPRVTRVGKFLRKSSIDELPQFWNILRGEMSLVGPRPEELWVVERYNDEQRKRLAVKPGLTGPMQIAGRGELDMDTRLELEMNYIKNYSLWRDLQIIFQTIPTLFSGKGAM
jgi:lipopolysaccharide/colanic/teichoic acid biosynthesis glycosyltransferase/glycosyltransferase involved in cell wall biosynthesis